MHMGYARYNPEDGKYYLEKSYYHSSNKKHKKRNVAYASLYKRILTPTVPGSRIDFDFAGPEQNATSDPALDFILIEESGIYEITASVTTNLGPNGFINYFIDRIGGPAITGGSFTAEGSGTNTNGVTTQVLLNAGDRVFLRVGFRTGGITYGFANLTLHRVD
ncbi:hypothetical protein ABD68_00510 [Bacillus endophyticus]|uniref:hypothetical protein n=1 Tax=Priestia endophytica TaxID=135735 RepID=UPI0018CDBB7A|nr:hypothetical protein [Priestia endophytica]MBG9810151.1 hypothetical protein [Priestia endophytica]